MTGFTFSTQSSTFYTPPASPPTLASFIGYWPATVNMIAWSGSDGKTMYGGHTDFTDNVNYWNIPGDTPPGGGVTISTTNVVSYDGTLTVQKLVENSANSTHSVACNRLSQDTTAYNPFVYRVMAIAAAAERTRIVLRVTANSQTFDASVGFDLAGGNTGYDVANNTLFTVVAQQMINLGTIAGNTFWACIFDFQFNQANTGLGVLSGGIAWSPEIILDNGSGTAARSTTYTGNGTSGVYITLVSLLPKALWTTRTRVFFDDFPNLNSIDVNNTKGSQFNWFTDNNFPNSSPPNFFGNPTPEPHTPAATFSMYQPSIMQMQGVTGLTSSNFNCSCETVCYTSGTGLGSIRGKYWAPPAIFDAYMAIDGQTFDSGSNLNNYSFWSVAAETLAGTVNANGNYLEYDFTDSGISQGHPTSQASPLYWDSSNGFSGAKAGCTFGGFTNNLNGSPQGITPLSLSNLFRATGVWLDATSGSSGTVGWSYFITFVNGQYCYGIPFSGNAFTYNTTGPTSHPSTANGAWFAAAETQHLMLFLWAPAKLNQLGAATLWDWVAVWQ